MRYRPNLPLVLKNVDFHIKPREKVGVVGRTGSGKSSMILSLTRIVEMAGDPIYNWVKIDGINISSIGLHYLRGAITIIPQDPIMLQGTIMFNVDPLETYPKSEIVLALKKVQVWDTLTWVKKDTTTLMPGSKPMNIGPPGNKPIVVEEDIKEEDMTEEELQSKKLNMFVEAGGGNLSIGQKQLICIARALISKPKILMMDEATANIDEKTDQAIQQLIKSEFKNTTVITIAHRLNTIIQYDKLLILEYGKLVEFGSPRELLEKTGGYFRGLVLEGGEEFVEDMFELIMVKE